MTDFHKSIELEITPRVQRNVVNGQNVLLSPFSELVKDVQLQRYIERYAAFYTVRLENIADLQTALNVLKEHTVTALEEATNR